MLGSRGCAKISVRPDDADQRPGGAAGRSGGGGLRRQIHAAAPDAELNEIEAVRLDGAKLAEITSASLFSTQRAAVITNLAELPTELYPSLISLAAIRSA